MTSSDPEGTIYEGQLCKKGKFNKSWKNRWCSLCTIKGGEIVLEYYDSKINRKICGTVDLSQVYAVEVISDYDINLMKQLPENILINTTVKSDKQFSFKISTSNRQYVFAAFDPPSFFTWIKTLDKYIYGGVIKQGWMFKKGDKNKGWKRRYFVLTEHKQIKYYQDFEKTSFCGVINVNKVSSITNGKVYNDEFKYAFQLITGKRIWILCCKDMKEREEWHNQIKSVRGVENLTNVLTPKMKHAHMDQLSKLKYLDSDHKEKNENEIDKNICVSIRNCKALNRITMNLHFYQTMIMNSSNDIDDTNNGELLLNYFEHNKNILNDYGHILQCHLNKEDRIKSNEIFEIIYDTIRKYVNCDIENCQQYKRYLRDRINDAFSHENHTVAFYMDILDTIHCNFIHSYDIGYRINTSQLHVSNNENVEDDYDMDFEMNYFHKLLKLKRKIIPQHRNHKYCTSFINTSRKARNSMSIDENDTFDDEKAMVSDIEQCVFYNDYVKSDLIGDISGTFGSTYICYKINNKNDDEKEQKQLYAVKQISKAKLYRIEASKRIELIQNIKNEMEVMTVLKHDNIITLHQIYEDMNFVYLVMNYLNGIPLLDKICMMTTLSETQISNVLKQILSGLSYMQSNNICHFNVKPSNIIVISDNNSYEFMIKLTDFGMASMIQKLHVQQTFIQPYYTAPEIINNEKYDRASDVWSIGIILFCILFGYPPFYIHENTLNNFGKKQQDEIYELIKQGFNPEIRKGYGPWFPKDINISKKAMSLMEGMLKYNISDRLTLTECLKHKWIVNNGTDTILPETVVSSLKNFISTNKFKELIIKLFTNKLNLTTYSNILTVFKKYDVKNEGEIELFQFRVGIQKAFTGMNDNEINKIFEHLDMENDTRTISIDELIISSAFNSLINIDEQMHQSFCTLDKNENGMIKIDELKKVIQDLDDVKYIENIDVTIQEIDVNDNGEINYELFLREIHPQYNERIRRDTKDMNISKTYQFEEEKNNKSDSGINIKKMVGNIMSFNMKPKKLMIINENQSKENNGKEIIINDTSFGMKFNYIDTKDKFYVKPKYNNLKQEVTVDLALDRYEYLLFKADYFMDCDSIKMLEANIDIITLEHEIKIGDIITLEHVFAVILYSDYDILHNNIRKTFRKLNEGETDESFKQRHSNYYHVCKLLYESVNVFGKELNCNMYHCIMNNVIFDEFNVNIYGIISVTKQIEIVINCIMDSQQINNNNNGMILELNELKNNKMYGFNCNFLSGFSNENEMILFGSSNKINVESVSILRNDKWQWNKITKYMKMINIYENALNGKKPIDNNNINDNVFKCISELIGYKLDVIKDNNYNIAMFMHKYFHFWCMKNNKIIIDLKYIEEFYNGFSSYLISSKNNQLLKFNEIVKLFTNCKYIITQNNDSKTQVIITNQYFDELLSMIDEINNHSNLKAINIINPILKCSKMRFQYLKDKFKEKQWIINNDNNSILRICKQ